MASKLKHSTVVKAAVDRLSAAAVAEAAELYADEPESSGLAATPKEFGYVAEELLQQALERVRALNKEHGAAQERWESGELIHEEFFKDVRRAIKRYR